MLCVVSDYLWKSFLKKNSFSSTVSVGLEMAFNFKKAHGLFIQE